MTIAEISRAIESKKRVQLEQDKKQASHFYILADMVGRSVSRIYNANSELPPISKVYPQLFDQSEADEIIQKNQDKLSALRFKQFAQSYNDRYKGGGN